MKWETQGGKPTRNLLLSEITELLRQLEEKTAMVGHLEADNDKLQSHGWLGISQLLQRMLNILLQHITAQGKLH